MVLLVATPLLTVPQTQSVGKDRVVNTGVHAQLDADQVSTHSSTPLPSRALYSWGSNDWGQLARGHSGNGAPTPVTSPAAIAPPSGDPYRSITAGGAFTVGLSATGRVSSWGANFSGQLGVGSQTNQTAPQLVDVPDGPIVAVAAGSSHALALTSGGKVYAWGAGQFGQLGDGGTRAADVPVAVNLPSGVTVAAIAAGGDHSLALTSDGKVYAWGANFDGQLGNDSNSPSSTPVLAQAPAGVTFTAIAAGTAFSLALSSTGIVYSWGSNASGQLGNGTTADGAVMTPVTMPTGTKVTAIACGSAHSLALTSTGKVFAWGSDMFGQLDSALVDSLPTDSPLPLQPLGLPPRTAFIAVEAGIDSSYALTSAGVAWVWGGNAYGQLGMGSPGLNPVLPEALSTLPPGTLATGLFSGPDASSAYLITRSNQSISFPSLPTPTYGDPPVDVTPTSDSGLAVPTHASGACAGRSSQLRLVGAGVCHLDASQTGSFWFYPATATTSFGVARATLTIDAASTSATVGDLPTSYTYRLSGFKDGDRSSAVSGQASCSSPATLTSPAGTFPITCLTGTLSATNYRIVPGLVGTLTLVSTPFGYAVVGSDGSVYALGPGGGTNASATPFYGSMAGQPLNAPVVGAAFTPRHNGYWLVGSDGGIFSFGAATFFGSMGGIPLNRPIVGITSTPDGGGYWEVASDGGVFAFGDAGFFGSTGGMVLNRPIVGMASAPDGKGYWMVASDGGIFAFGDAGYFGSTGGLALGEPVVGLAATPTGNGYWITTATGAVFAFGRAPFEGSLRFLTLSAPVVGITSSYDGKGYWLATSDGGVFAFGDAGYFGRAESPPVPIDGIT
jgi:hypothetical protein